jgi:hypothetical protein
MVNPQFPNRTLGKFCSRASGLPDTHSWPACIRSSLIPIIRSSASLTEQHGDQTGTSTDQKSNRVHTPRTGVRCATAPSRFRAIAPDHPWYDRIGKIVSNSEPVRSGRIRKTATFTGHGADFFIDQAAESDGDGYLAGIRLTLGYTGFEAAEDVANEYARFSTLENCMAWIKERTGTRLG